MLELYNGITLVIESPKTDRVDIITTGGTFIVKTPHPLTQQELEVYLRNLISTPVTTVYEIDIKSESGSVRQLSLVGSSIVGGRLRNRGVSSGKMEVNIYDRGNKVTGANKATIFDAIRSNPMLFLRCEDYFAKSNYSTDFKTYLNKNLSNMRRS